jgi:predicted porin
MQKKLIALAVASLVSGAAFAQVAPNNVTMSGIVDMGYQYSSDNVADNVPSQNAFNDGGHDGSRLKFAGTEDLGNGLKVGFQLDYRFATDVHSSVTTDNQNLWLGGSWGTVTAGTFGTAPDDINGYSEAGGMGWGNGVIGMFMTPGYHSNAVKYNSPNFNGLDFMVAVSTNNDGTADGLGTLADDNRRGASARVSYVAGPIKAGLAVARDKMQEESSRRTEWLLSGSYNFGPVILGAGYSRTSYSDGLISNTDLIDSRRAYRINIGAPIGANDAVALSYSRAKWDLAANGDSEKASGWGLSYTHNLSKRTNLYASVSQASQDDDNVIKYTTNGGYQKAFKIGLRHQF